MVDRNIRERESDWATVERVDCAEEEEGLKSAATCRTGMGRVVGLE